MKRVGLISILLLACILLPMAAAGCIKGLSSLDGTNTPLAVQVTTPSSTLVDPSSLANLASMLDIVEHSVMEIKVQSSKIGSKGGPIESEDSGSAWVIAPSGILVTCEHVIDGATSIMAMTIDGKSYPAKIVNSDPVADIAVLKINAGTLLPLKVTDTSKLKVGVWVVAVGNPLGQGISAKQGIISRLRVDMPYNGEQMYHNMIEVSAAINPGNSGGPLVNLAGEVIGIITLKVSQLGVEGLGYAINMNDAVPIIERLAVK